MAIDVDPTEDILIQADDVSRLDDAVGGQLNDPAVVGASVATPNHPGLQRFSTVRLAGGVGLVAVVVLGSLTGWLGYRAYQSQAGQEQRDRFVQVARQAAINLTTISYTEAEADVSRVIDSSVGAFRDEFQSRATDFIGVVKKAQSKSQGTVSEAGLESDQGGQGRVLVAVSVKTATPADSNPAPRGWRMRITVQPTSDGPKVSNVEFVP